MNRARNQDEQCVPWRETTQPARDTFAPTKALKAGLAGAVGLDSKQFRDDLDMFVDQDPTPRS
jgi:hypothetical protein